MPENQNHHPRIRHWRLEYSDGHYTILDPDGVRAQESLPVTKDPEWRTEYREGRYCAVDQNGVTIPDSGVLEDYQIIALLSFGGSSLCYKAVNRSTGRIAVIKELYPYSLAKKGLLIRDGIMIREKPDPDPEEHEQVKRTFEKGFSQEQEANDSVRFYRDETGETNDPRFLSSSPIPFAEHAGALNQYQVIDTQAGTFLDRVEFAGNGRDRVIDILSLAKQLLIAVSVLHSEKRRVHLDLKPENILVSKVHINNEEQWGNHPVILIDFGSSVPVDDSGRLSCKENEVNLTSTADYAAPEVKNAALDSEYSSIGTWSDIYSVFIILQHMLLSDAADVGDDDFSSDIIRSGKSVGELGSEEQQLLVDLLRNGIETRRIDTADKGIAELDTIISVLNDRGIHPVIIRKNAVRRAKEIREKDRIIESLLCDVEIESK